MVMEVVIDVTALLLVVVVVVIVDALVVLQYNIVAVTV